ncbi:hypothetical protein TYRP_000819 [Tyrophagus putrescentiae]|nr:hypothetical protein TYRP_000819 [Tyrophagus putrescentiae]
MSAKRAGPEETEVDSGQDTSEIRDKHQLKGIKVTRRGGHRVDLGQEEEEAEAEREVEEGEEGGGLGEHEDDAQQADWGGGQFEEEG